MVSLNILIKKLRVYPLTENYKTFKELSIETWNKQINLLNVQEIITDYIVDLFILNYKNYSNFDSCFEIDEDLNMFLKYVVSYENKYIEKRYWFINKKVVKKTKDFLNNFLKDELKELPLLTKLQKIKSIYDITKEFSDSYFNPEFLDIGDECCSFIIPLL